MPNAIVLLLRRRAVAYAQSHVSNLTGIQSKGRQATLKHLVCNDSETSRREYDVQVDERVLREVYLRPFEIAVKESDPSSIMAAYNNVVCTHPWCWSPLARDRIWRCIKAHPVFFSSVVLIERS